MNTDRIHIDAEEDGFHLLVKTEDGDWFDFKITDPEALYNAVRAEIRPWLYERNQAKLAFLCTPDESASMAQSLTDIWRDELGPKHPDFHSVHADIWDAREGK